MFDLCDSYDSYDSYDTPESTEDTDDVNLDPDWNLNKSKKGNDNNNSSNNRDNLFERLIPISIPTVCRALRATTVAARGIVRETKYFFFAHLI